jgi:hypothetical protein
MLSTGFHDAPVTRIIVYGLIATSVLASITDSKYYFYIQVQPHLWQYHQLWRIFIYQLCYTNSTEVLFAAMSFYNVRVIERLWGSRKYAVGLGSLLHSRVNAANNQAVLCPGHLPPHHHHPTIPARRLLTASLL